MRYLIPGVVVLAAVTFFFVQRPARAPELPGVEAPRGAEVPRPVSQPVVGAADTRIVPVAAPAALSVRAAVAAPEAEANPCAEILKALQASDAARAVLERERDELRDQVMTLTHELRAVQFPEDTPYGAFLASNECKQIMEMLDGVMYQKKLPESVLASGRKPPKPEPAGEVALRGIKSWLKLFPIFLLPGEATWIAERTVAHDWGSWGPGGSERALILFLGPVRLMAELPEARAAELREDYAEEGIFD